MEINITELRRQRTPLWLSDLDVDDYEVFLGGGGDIFKDRLPPMWERHTGQELTEEEMQEIANSGLILSTDSKAAA